MTRSLLSEANNMFNEEFSLLQIKQILEKVLAGRDMLSDSEVKSLNNFFSKDKSENLSIIKLFLSKIDSFSPK